MNGNPNTITSREILAQIAEEEALHPFHGYVMSLDSNIEDIIRPFPKWNLKEADGKWCAAFVYYCCNKAGYNLPVRSPNPEMKFNFAGCLGWEQWANLDENRFYTDFCDVDNSLKRGDIMLFDNVFDPGPHDHIGIIIDTQDSYISVAEGNVNNLSTIIKRPKDRNIRAIIRIPNGWRYQEEEVINE